MNENSFEFPLPAGWVATTLGQILSDIQPGFASGKHLSNGEGLPHLRPMNVSRDGRIDRTDLRSVDPDLADRSSRRLRVGDVLFNNTNSLELVGKTALFEGDDEPAFSNHMTRLRVNEESADPAFVAELLHGRWQAGDFQRLANNHVSQASVGRGVLTDLPIALPPLDEQRRIAAILDRVHRHRASISDRLRAARRVLDRVHSVALSAACLGRITADWREEHAGFVTRDLLRLAEDRRRAQGGRFVPPRLNGYASGIGLPAAWTVAPLGLLLENLKYGTSRRSAYDQPGTPVLRIPNVSSGLLRVDDLKFAELDDRERDSLRLRPGDLLMIRSNGSVQLVGKTTAVTAAGAGMAYAGYLIRLRVDRDLVNPDFLRLILASPQLRHQIELPARSTSGVHNLNTQEIRGLGIPLPSLDEQAEIVRRAEAALAVVDRLTAQIGDVGGTLDRVLRGTVVRALRGSFHPTGVRPN